MSSCRAANAKAFGAQGFIAVPGERGTIPDRAFYRASWEEMEYVGRATFVPSDVAEDEEDQP